MLVHTRLNDSQLINAHDHNAHLDEAMPTTTCKLLRWARTSYRAFGQDGIILARWYYFGFGLVES
jgi:hypothetical protein